ncbi:MAG: hypothetical protein JNN12_13330 [Bacteroidetes Order II. Incertae sedis bacterium]|nr:hypothetical protein [Bacteroidetes Order II. bacterium]
MKKVSRFFWYDLEDEFGILMTPEEQQRTRTYGDLLHLIGSKMGRIPSEATLQRVFEERAKWAIATVFEIPSEKVRLSDSLTHVLDKIPSENDMALLSIQANVDFHPVSDRFIHTSVRLEQGGMAFLVLLGTVLGILFTDNRSLQIMGMAALALVAIWVYGFRKMEQQKKAAYSKILVSDMVSVMTKQFLEGAPSYPQSLSSEDLEQQFRRLFIEGYEIPEATLQPHADLIRDLHLDENEDDNNLPIVIPSIHR